MHCSNTPSHLQTIEMASPSAMMPSKRCAKSMKANSDNSKAFLKVVVCEFVRHENNNNNNNNNKIMSYFHG